MQDFTIELWLTWLVSSDTRFTYIKNLGYNWPSNCNMTNEIINIQWMVHECLILFILVTNYIIKACQVWSKMLDSTFGHHLLFNDDPNIPDITYVLNQYMNLLGIGNIQKFNFKVAKVASPYSKYDHTYFFFKKLLQLICRGV